MPFGPRDATLRKDSIIKNVINEQLHLRQRPGLGTSLDGGTVGQGLYWNGINLHAVIDDGLYTINPNYSIGLVSNPSYVPLSPALYFQEGGTAYCWTNSFVGSGGSSGFRRYSTSNGTVFSNSASTDIGQTAQVVKVGATYYALGWSFNFLGSVTLKGFYSSADGLTWSLVNAGGTTFAAAVNGVGGREGAALIYSGGKFWIIGGSNSGNSLAYTSRNDVWSSSDLGVSWTLEYTEGTGPGTEGGSILTYVFSVGSSFYWVRGADKLYKSSSLSSGWSLVNTDGWISIWNQPCFWVVGTTLYRLVNSGIIYNIQYSSDGVTWQLFASDIFAGISLPSPPVLWGFSQIGNNIYFYTKTTPIKALGLTSPSFTLIGSLTTPTTAGIPFDLTSINPSTSSAGIFLKSTKDAYYYNGSSLVKVTDADYPTTTVRGLAYLDGTYYVMTPEGKIYGSDIENPSSWSALNVISCQSQTDGGVYITRHLNYVLAFGDWSTEFFYDAGNPTGSPLGPIGSSQLLIGCAHAGSVSQTENTIVWMGVTRQRGRSIYIMQGTQPQKISSIFVDRILDSDSLSDVSSFIIRDVGHNFYVLNLGNTNISLVYDFATQQWTIWTSLTAGSTTTGYLVSGQSYRTITINKTSHGFSTGDIIKVSGTVSGYYKLIKVDNNNFTIELESDTALTLPDSVNGLITSIIKYTEVKFSSNYYSYILGKSFLLDSQANLYDLSNSNFTDNGSPIHCSIQTPRMDFGSTKRKFLSMLEVESNQDSFKVYEEHTDDDFSTWSDPRTIWCGEKRKRAWRLGSFSQRGFRFSTIDATEKLLQAVELEVI